MKLADKNDIDKLALIRVKEQKEDWENEFEDRYDLLSTTKSYLEKHLNKDFFAFVEEINNKIVATCCLQIIDYLPQCNDNGKQGFICNVYTDEKYRRKGLQKELLNQVIKYSKDNNLCELDLSTSSDNAISLYKKFGFEFDSWAMKKELNNGRKT